MPSIIGHRGVPGECPENTLAGFALALEQGADGVELDVHATSDGVIVVHHDPVIPSLRNPESGVGRIAELTWSEVRCRGSQETPIPRLEEVLELVEGRATAYVEVKAPGIEEALVPHLRGRESWCAVHSFDHRIPVVVSRLLPTIGTGLLSCSYPLDVGAQLHLAGARQFWQSESLIDESLVRAVRAAGAEVVAWTVNSVARALELAAMGVDAICTDRPGALREELRRRSASD